MFDSARGGLTRIRWLPCQNTTANDIPGFAVMRVTGVADPSTTDNEYVLQVDQPNASDAIYCVNGPQVIKAQGANGPGWGNCSLDFPNFVLYDSGSGTPSANAKWGPKSGSWKLDASKTGFLTFNQPKEGRVLVVEDKAPSKTFTIYNYNPSDLAPTTIPSGGTSLLGGNPYPTTYTPAVGNRTGKWLVFASARVGTVGQGVVLSLEIMLNSAMVHSGSREIPVYTITPSTYGTLSISGFPGENIAVSGPVQISNDATDFIDLRVFSSSSGVSVWVEDIRIWFLFLG